MTTNENLAPPSTRRVNASHANCDHDATKSARAKCRRTMRLGVEYDALRVDPSTRHIDAAALIANVVATDSEIEESA